MRRTMGLAIAPVLLLAGGAASAALAAPPPCRAGAVGTIQTAVVAGRAREYRVCAGSLPIRDPAGAVTGSIFYTAYLLAAPARQARPLAFVWNGGPGSDSRLLQFHALAPRTLHGGRLADNEASPVDAADLVFVDPVGTGFSRAATPAAAAAFYGTNEDIAATTRFVQSFVTAYARPRAPLFLVGESFGTWRAAGVADALADARVPVAGLVLISGGIPLGDTNDRALMRALSLPNRTATALARKRLAPALQADPRHTLAKAAAWAASVYAPALAHPAALAPDARSALIATLASYQGLPPEAIDAATLWVSPRQFRSGLVDGDPPLNVFDMRQRGELRGDPGDDRAIVEFYRHTLGVAGGAYAGLEEPAYAVGAHWRYDQAPITPESLARAQAGEGPPSPSQPWTLRAMQKMPTLRTWVAAGNFDSLNSCLGNAATLGELPPDVSRRFLLHCYAGGHMMYEDPAVAPAFGADLRAFLAHGL